MMKSFDSLSILVVEDSRSMRQLICGILKKNGFSKITEASDGKDALDAACIKTPDLIISDLNMPKVNGVELLDALQKHSSFKTIPFIVLTSETGDETFKKIMKMGAADFIKKPFNEQEFMVKIKSIIEWLA